jgi:hypothetical protein
MMRKNYVSRGGYILMMTSSVSNTKFISINTNNIAKILETNNYSNYYC